MTPDWSPQQIAALDRVTFDQSSVFREDARRHLYTGITRASERLTIVMAEP